MVASLAKMFPSASWLLRHNIPIMHHLALNMVRKNKTKETQKSRDIQANFPILSPSYLFQIQLWANLNSLSHLLFVVTNVQAICGFCGKAVAIPNDDF